MKNTVFSNGNWYFLRFWTHALWMVCECYLIDEIVINRSFDSRPEFWVFLGWISLNFFPVLSQISWHVQDLSSNAFISEPRRGIGTIGLDLPFMCAIQAGGLHDDFVHFSTSATNLIWLFLMTKKLLGQYRLLYPLRLSTLTPFY